MCLNENAGVIRNYNVIVTYKSNYKSIHTNEQFKNIRYLKLPTAILRIILFTTSFC